MRHITRLLVITAALLIAVTGNAMASEGCACEGSWFSVVVPYEPEQIDIMTENGIQSSYVNQFGENGQFNSVRHHCDCIKGEISQGCSTSDEFYNTVWPFNGESWVDDANNDCRWVTFTLLTCWDVTCS